MMNDKFWVDERLVSTMNFGMDDLAGQEAITESLRQTFAEAGCVTADDIANLGCTGLYKSRTIGQGEDPQVALRTVDFVRSKMAGAGLGLTCFVGSDRYCLAHQTIGGLQPKQTANHVEFVEVISRELTPAERGHVALINHARKAARGKAKSERMNVAQANLTGEDVPDDLDPVKSGATPDVVANVGAPAPAVASAVPVNLRLALSVLNEALVTRNFTLTAHSLALISNADLREALSEIAMQVLEPTNAWKCTEHATPHWPCRYCAAQMIVAGSLEPKYLLAPTDYENLVTSDAIDSVAADLVDETVKRLADNGATAIGLFAKVTAWRERFVRDE